MTGFHFITLQNKDREETEREKEEEKAVAAAMLGRPSGARRGRPLGRAGPGGPAGRGAPRTPGSEGRSNGRGRAEAPSTVANGDSKTGPTERAQTVEWGAELTCCLSFCCADAPRRRTRRTSGMYDSDRASNGEFHLPIPTSCLVP